MVSVGDDGQTRVSGKSAAARAKATGRGKGRGFTPQGRGKGSVSILARSTRPEARGLGGFHRNFVGMS